LFRMVPGLMGESRGDRHQKVKTKLAQVPKQSEFTYSAHFCSVKPRVNPTCLGLTLTSKYLSRANLPKTLTCVAAGHVSSNSPPLRHQVEARKELPKQVPAPTRTHLATPAGILFNELTHSPASVTEPVLRMVELAGTPLPPISRNFEPTERLALHTFTRASSTDSTRSTHLTLTQRRR